MSRRVEVRVPGSLVRAGGGATIAADCWVRASFALDALSNPVVQGRPEDDGRTSGVNAVVAGFRAACAASRRDVPTTLRVRAVSDIPAGVELGAAAAATVAGIVGARALLALALDDDAVVRLAGAQHGAMDRAFASLAGHVCAVYPTCDDGVSSSAS